MVGVPTPVFLVRGWSDPFRGSRTHNRMEPSQMSFRNMPNRGSKPALMWTKPHVLKVFNKTVSANSRIFGAVFFSFSIGVAPLTSEPAIRTAIQVHPNPNQVLGSGTNFRTQVPERPPESGSEPEIFIQWRLYLYVHVFLDTCR